jgi:hypothetical protein
MRRAAASAAGRQRHRGAQTLARGARSFACAAASGLPPRAQRRPASQAARSRQRCSEQHATHRADRRHGAAGRGAAGGAAGAQLRGRRDAAGQRQRAHRSGQSHAAGTERGARWLRRRRPATRRSSRGHVITHHSSRDDRRTAAIWHTGQTQHQATRTPRAHSHAAAALTRRAAARAPPPARPPPAPRRRSCRRPDRWATAACR